MIDVKQLLGIAETEKLIEICCTRCETPYLYIRPPFEYGAMKLVDDMYYPNGKHPRPGEIACVYCGSPTFKKKELVSPPQMVRDVLVKEQEERIKKIKDYTE